MEFVPLTETCGPVYVNGIVKEICIRSVCSFGVVVFFPEGRGRAVLSVNIYGMPAKP